MIAAGRWLLVAGFSILFALAMWASEPSSQVQHPIIGREIPVDDFPVLVPGYRIQIGSYNSQKKADHLKQQLKAKLDLKIHLRQEDDRWLVRVGDFRDSTAAITFLHGKSFAAWAKSAALVADNIPVSPDSLPPPPLVPGYRLQVYALADKDKAIKSARNLTCLFPDLRVHVISTDTLFKVQLGDFKDSTEVATWKEKVSGTADLKPIMVQMPVFDLPPPRPEMSPPADIFEYDD